MMTCLDAGLPSRILFFLHAMRRDGATRIELPETNTWPV